MSNANNSLFIYLIILKFCTEHGSDTAMLCAKFQNNFTSELGCVTSVPMPYIYLFLSAG